MSENRRQILEMLSQGKITATEAEGLISALEREPALERDYATAKSELEKLERQSAGR